VKPPQIPADSRDESHLSALSICYFISAGLSLLGIVFLFLHHAFLKKIFLLEEVPAGPLPPAELFETMKWFYFVAGVLLVAQGVLNYLCGYYLRKRKASLFISMVAGLSCLFFPLGTVLGVFTFIVMARSSVKSLF
jgi:hypothetical protein